METTWQIISNLEDFRGMGEEWNALFEESGVESIFMTFDWIISWLEEFGLEGEIFILKGEGDDWKGFFPFFRRVRSLPLGKLWTVSFVGEPLSDRCDFIISGDRWEAIGALLTYCRENHDGCDILRLQQIASDSPNARVLRKILERRGVKFNIRVCDRAPFIPLPSSWDQYVQSLSRSFKKKIRKYFRSARESGALRIEELPLSPETWEIIQDISRRSTKNQRGVAFFEQGGMKSFMRNLLPRLRAAGRLKITALYIGSRPIAYDIGFKGSDKIWSYDSAFDQEFTAEGSGHLLLALLIEEAIEQGCREFDLLRGAEDYKFNWSDRYREHLEFILYHPGLLSDLVRVSHRFRKAAKYLARKEFCILGRKGWLLAFTEWLPFRLFLPRRRLSVTATTRKGGLSLKVLTSLEEARELEEKWKELFKQTREGTIFMSYEWIISWLEVFGGEGEIMILAAYRKNELIGLCPLILRKGRHLRCPVRILEFIGTPLSDRTDLVLSEMREDVMVLFWDYLWECRSRWDLIRLSQIQAGSLNLTILGDLLIERKIPHRFRTCSISPYIILDRSWPDYLMSRSKPFRKTIRRDLRRINSKGEVRLVSGLASDLKTIKEISLRSPKTDRGTALLNRTGIEQFTEKVLRRFDEAGWSNLKILTLEGEPIAYKLNFKYGNKILLYNSSFRSDYSEYHPGYVIMALLIQEGIQEGIREIDYLRGDEHFKFHYTNDLRYHREIVIYKKSLIPDVLRCIFTMNEFRKRLRGKGVYPI